MPYKDPDVRRARNREYMRKYYSDPTNKAKHVTRIRKHSLNHRDQLRSIVEEFKARGCRFCSECASCALSAHHLDPSRKEFNIANGVIRGVSIEVFILELSKCICVCHNCHSKIHAKILDCSDFHEPCTGDGLAAGLKIVAGPEINLFTDI